MSKVLKGLTVCASGTLSMTRNEFADLVKENGGKFSKTVTKNLTHLITTEKEFDDVTEKVSKAQGYDIPIVSEDFINDSIEQGKLANVDDYLFDKSTKSKAPAAKPEQKKTAKKTASKKRKRGDDDDDEDKDDDKEEKEEDEEEEERPKKKARSSKVVAKGGYPVDPFAKCDDAKIFVEDGVAWTSTMNQTNIGNNNNKFYIVQLIDHGDKTYSCYTRWGRVGANGQTKFTTEQGSLADAKEDFEKKFKDKSGNKWGVKPYVEKKGKYAPIELDYSGEDAKDDGDDEEDDDGDVKMKNATKVESTLAPSVQQLIKMIANVDTMTETLREFDIDLKKMPLGKISKKQIQEGYKVLKDIQDVIKGDLDDDLADLSSSFYTKIPHDFGRNRPPVINNEQALKKKIEMMETLAELETASILLESAKKTTKHPLDAAYESLNTTIIPLDKNSDEYKLLVDYVKNTHAPTHPFKLEVVDIFTVDRAGERERYEKGGMAFGNRRLLWHGSRITNFMGILSKGLLIAPPSAPVTGYMFGKGIYFADSVSKSANYCYASKAQPEGCILLSEVALGDMMPLDRASYTAGEDSAKQKKHSTWGRGRSVPNPKEYQTLEDGTVVPCGKLVASPDVPATASLLYNEFIVYNLAQANLRYMIRLKFGF